jgi:hypothetical protein
MTATLVVAGWVALSILAAAWFHYARGGTTPDEPIDEELRQLLDDEVGS